MQYFIQKNPIPTLEEENVLIDWEGVSIKIIVYLIIFKQLKT